MSFTDLIALLIAGLTLASAGLVVFSRNAIHAAFYLLLALFGVACEYALLSAHFLAIVQVLVYAGAVVTLLVFVFMMMGFGRDQLANYEISGSALALPVLLVASLLVVGGVGVFHGKPLKAPSISKAAGKAAPVTLPGKKKTIAAAPTPTFGTIDTVGKHLVTHNVLAFELIAVLLMMSTVGVLLILREREVPPEAEGGH